MVKMSKTEKEPSPSQVGEARCYLSEDASTKGLVFNIQRFSIHDGPGIGTTIFLKGCPLACIWCSNPESQKPYPEIITLDRTCLLCGKCAEVCQQKAISLEKSRRKIEWDLCNQCLECAKVCPSGAIRTVGNYLDADEVVAELIKDEIFYRNSGGGITVSGGEPLLQWKFVYDLLKKCKTIDLHTTMETCGYASWDKLDAILEYTDLVLYDIKLMDSTKHKALTGVANELIIENAVKVAQKKPTWLRFPIIPGYNDSDSSIKQVIKFAAAAPFKKVSLLPYHSMGEQKYERLGRNYTLQGVSPPSDDEMKQIAQIFEYHGLNVTISY